MLKQLRKLHLYLGVLFAPMLAFFACTGALQVLGLHEGAKGDPPPPAWIAHAAAIHKDARFALGRGVPPSHPFQFFVLAMAAGMILSACLGVYMGFAYKNDKRVLVGLLAAGVLIPVIALALA